MKLDELKVIKKSSDFSTFTAVIMEPNAVDAHGDIASEETIKKAAHDYIKNQKMVCGINHEEVTQDVVLVESYLLKNKAKIGGQEIEAGAWIGEFEVNNAEKKEDILKGNFTGVSIGGKAITSEIRKSLEAKRKLDVVYVNEISLVDAPANNRPILQINKNKGGKKMKFEEIMKSIEEDEGLSQKIEKALKSKKKKEEDDEEDEEEEIQKSLSPKMFERFKQMQNQVVELNKKQENIEKRAFAEKTVELEKAKIKVTPTLSESLYKISKSNPDAYKDIEKALFDAADTLKKNKYTVPVGADVHDEGSMTEGDQIVSVAKRMVKENPSLSLSKAFDTVIKNKLHKQEN